jgi:hypothetical protein
MSNPAPSPKKRIEKPLGVYILTLVDFVFLGIYPLVLIYVLKSRQDIELPAISFVTGISLALLIMAVSVWASFGDNPARYLLLTLVTISSSLIIFNNVTLMASGEIEGGDKISSVGHILRGLVWLSVNWWYLTRPNTVAYYKQNTWR